MSASTLNRRQRVIDYKLAQIKIPVVGKDTLKSILTKIIALAIPAFLIISFFSSLAYGADQEAKNQALKDQNYCKTLTFSAPTCN